MSEIVGIEENFRESQEELKRELADLEARSKPLDELIVSVLFNVEEVISQSRATSFTPISEMMIGGESPVYYGGLTTKLILKVTPDHISLPVRTLIFPGYSIVKGGDSIVAKIPRYETKNFLSGRRTFYLDRVFRQEEECIEIKVLSENGKILRRDRSMDYENFFKSEIL